MSFVRKIYEWVLSWADKPSGPAALGVMSMAEASFFPIPPDVLLIPLALGKREKALDWFAAFVLFWVLLLDMGSDFGYGGQNPTCSQVSPSFFLIISLVSHTNHLKISNLCMMSIISWSFLQLDSHQSHLSYLPSVPVRSISNFLCLFSRELWAEVPDSSWLHF